MKREILLELRNYCEQERDAHQARANHLGVTAFTGVGSGPWHRDTTEEDRVKELSIVAKWDDFIARLDRELR